LTAARNFSTSLRMVSAWRCSSETEPRTRSAALPVARAASLTPPILAVTSAVPEAACCTLRAISSVAEPCCLTATAMPALTSLISPIVVPMPLMAPTERCVASYTAAICAVISSVALAV
jgi:hypothetical protein